MVSYKAGQGFYQDRDRAISFDELPEGPHSDADGPEPPDGRQWWPTVQTHADDLDVDTSSASSDDTQVSWVTCVYQITEDDVWIWPVERSRL